jgi:hypothetical protein
MTLEKFLTQRQNFVSASKTLRPEFLDYYDQPCLDEDTNQTSFDLHYLYSFAWALRRVLSNSPKHHVDIGSSLYLSAGVSAEIPTTFIDFRPAKIELKNLSCAQGDLSDSTQWRHRHLESVSCIHVVEHIGLAQYGDPLDVNADVTAIRNLISAAKIGGKIYFSVPVGRPEIYFNAHRIYKARWIAEFFAPFCLLNNFYLIPSDPVVMPISDCDLDSADKYSYASGCFEFVKIREIIW